MLLIIVSLVLMTLDHRQSHLENIRAGLMLLVAPLQYLADAPVSAADWAVESLGTRSQLLEENRRLQREQLLLRGHLQKYESLQRENERLRELLQSSLRLGETVLVGELLGVDLDPFKHLVVINRGARDAVFAGQPIIDAQGVMGQVVHVSPFTSTAMLITDPSHAIPVEVLRTGVRAIALGTGVTDRLELPHLPNNADLRVGDLLVTSGLGQRFPAGYPVGRITVFQRDPTQPYAQVVAKPTARLNRSREVLLVTRGRSAGEEP